MDLKIFWTESARNQLEDIFDYYKETASFIQAKKLVNAIYDKVIVLQKQPMPGQKEPLLKTRKRDYRTLVHGKYKIIYWTDEQYIKIAAIFDCRQNPNKIRTIAEDNQTEK